MQLVIEFIFPKFIEGSTCFERVEPSINFGIINSVTRLHLVGISTESYYDARIHDYHMIFVYSKYETTLCTDSLLSVHRYYPTSTRTFIVQS